MSATRGKRVVMWAAGAAVLAGGLLYGFWPRAVPVEVASVTRGPLRVTVNEDGRTRIKERYVVSTPLGGQLRRIELHAGDAVTAGETLLTTLEPMPPELLDTRSREQLEARNRAAEAQIESAAALLERAVAADELARTELDRTASLVEAGAASRQDLDRARETARAAAGELKAAGYARQIAEYELAQTRAALARVDLDAPRGAQTAIPIRAPVDGQVLRVFHEDAGAVAAGTRLIELGNPTDLEVEVDVLSSDAVRILPGARAYLEHWGGDAPLEARVRLVEPAGFLKISALGVEEQRVNVILDIVSPVDERRKLGDAYRVEARMVVWEADDVFTVPVGALFREGPEWSVFLLEGGRARRLGVTLGQSDGRKTEVVAGLNPGQEVIVHASDKVADGVRVARR